MGVPQFFAWLIKHNNTIISNKSFDNVDWLMFDLNCLLHPNVKYILDKNYENKTIIENFILERIIEHIDDVIKKTNPKNIYCAVDGTVPCGKLNQQRIRRFKNNSINIVNQSIDLSTGTPLMEKIHLHLLNYFKNHNINSIYSSYHTPQEGEHKILHFIKTLTNNNIIIYGLDADLIFLALTNNGLNNILIMREEQYFHNINVDDIQSIVYNYVNINDLKNIIKLKSIDVKDFIIICFLLGNDFMPNILSLSISGKGIEKIIDAYNKVKNKFKIQLIENNNLNILFLKFLFQELLWTENNVFSNMTNFDNEYFYYRYYNIIDKKSCVLNYIQSLYWCYEYYFNSCISNSFCYNYYSTPLIKDILKYFPSTISIPQNLKILNPIEQLILTIPKIYYETVFNDDILCKIKSIEKYIDFLFPTNFQIDNIRSNQEYKHHPLIPFVDFNFFYKIIKTININDNNNMTFNEFVFSK